MEGRANSLPVPASQRPAVPSNDAVTIFAPSGLKAAAVSQLSLESRASSLPVPASQSLAVPSSDAGRV
jgi:hypothetical protein